MKMKQANPSAPSPSLLFLFIITLSVIELSAGDPRSRMIQITCANQPEHNSTIFVPNFVAMMENISNQVRTSGFGVAISGSGPDANYGLAQCYGDLSLLDCVLCYAEARTVLPQCFPYNGGRIYLDGCFMRAQNYSFIEEYTGPSDYALCGNEIRKNSTFQESARQAIKQAVADAPNNNGYARSKVIVPGTANESAYVLADCWRTLNASSCRACLENASSSILGCLPWSEGRALNTGCFMRYSDTDFLNKEPDNGSSRGTVIIIVVPAVSAVIVLLVLGAIGVYIWKQRKIQRKGEVTGMDFLYPTCWGFPRLLLVESLNRLDVYSSNDAIKLVKTLHDSSLNFKYATLEKATGSFDNENKLGQGGFGTVYKGVLTDGREIAVKRLFFNNRHRAADFYNEVNIISSVEHKNLVRLLGCSCSGPESLLVYEYLPNKSLDRFIFDTNRGKALNWEKRCEIIIGTAEGLAYLHENSTNRIIHRDIKASNILLDSKMRAKIADFGLARSFQEDKSHITTAIAGTLGYMAPEYLAHGQLTEKVDVYSFGVLLLEIVTGRQNNRSKTSEYSDSIVTIAWKHFQLGTLEELFDPNLMLHNYHNGNIKNEVLRVMQIALLCTQEAPSLRPSMSKALQMLTKKDEHLPTPTNPPFIDERTMELNEACANPSYPLNAAISGSVANMSHSSFYPR
ncbi:Cysteine-rich receptor-like protein kinase 2 [Vitis vinifera]|uniref:Cysteine-rich receptor-like protein kinase 2 n=1 Tax=Vitis vinifera TaxID=29760 RepID=A0A438E6I7_VITVI|nr:Cysteine-rich receptor-like protein kinase 2 [Vitis vinifera]